MHPETANKITEELPWITSELIKLCKKKKKLCKKAKKSGLQKDWKVYRNMNNFLKKPVTLLGENISTRCLKI